MRRISDCIRDSISIAIPQTAEWQRIGNQMEAAFISARADFVNVHVNASHGEPLPFGASSNAPP